jgi:hypothetical protein
MATPESPNTRPTDLDITGNVDTPDTPAMPAPEASVTKSRRESSISVKADKRAVGEYRR